MIRSRGAGCQESTPSLARAVLNLPRLPGEVGPTVSANQAVGLGARLGVSAFYRRRAHCPFRARRRIRLAARRGADTAAS